MASIAVPFMVNPTTKTFRVLIAMEEETIDRIRSYDPAEVPFSDIFEIPMLKGFSCDGVALTYLSAEEMQWLTTEPTPTLKDVIQKLYRGYKFLPDKGDGEATKLFD